MFAQKPNRYPEQLIAPMRADLTQHGVEEARTPEDVDAFTSPNAGAVLMIVNSVCGCAAGKARPAVGLALRHSVRPDRAATVFAGADLEAVAHLRAKLTGVPPSSPSITLFRNGQPVFVAHRSDIESRDAIQLANLLIAAFEQHLSPVASA